jgi:CPA2 family monovalent cation:H+ antiporter-2
VFVGVIFDINFFLDHFGRILLLVLLVFALNTVVNAFVLRILGVDRTTATVAGCVLAQIGEFAFLLASTAHQGGIIEMEWYQTAVAVITLSLIFTPVWIVVARRLMRFSWGESGTMMFQQIKSEEK